jgi:hypothetical protein
MNNTTMHEKLRQRDLRIEELTSKLDAAIEDNERAEAALLESEKRELSALADYDELVASLRMLLDNIEKNGIK